MSARILDTKTMITLVKRELWEQKKLFLYLPILIALLTPVIVSIALIRAYILDIDFLGVLLNGPGRSPFEGTPGDIMGPLVAAPMESKERYWDFIHLILTPLFSTTYWCVMMYYFLLTLFNQRKDRSILFWNSMPVSDAQTILSKLIAGLLVCHGIFLLCWFLLQILLTGVFSLYGFFYGIPIWENFIAPSNILSRTLKTASLSFVSVFWVLPVYAWFLLASAWSRSTPVALALAPVLLMLILEIVLFRDPTPTMLPVFLQHTIPFGQFYFGPGMYQEALSAFFNLEMLFSVILGGIFIYAAIRFNRPEEF